MKYMQSLGALMLISMYSGAVQPLLSPEILNVLTKEQLIQIVHILAQHIEQQPPLTPSAARLPTAEQHDPPSSVECAHFLVDAVSQLAIVATTPTPQTTIQGITAVVHNLMDLIVQQRMPKRGLGDTQDSKYNAILDEVMEQLTAIDTILECYKPYST